MRLAAGATAALAMAMPAAAYADPWGISDTGLDVYGGSQAFLSYCGAPAGTTTCGSSGAADTDARRFMPWDAFGTYNGSACVSDSADPNDVSNHNGNVNSNLPADIKAWLTQARTDGLTPMLSVTPGPGNGLVNENASLYPHIPSDAQYKCGVEEAALQLDAASLPVHSWEAFNEPDGSNICGAAAALYYENAVDAVNLVSGHASDKVIAGAFKDGQDPASGTHPDCGHPTGNWYIPDYVGQLTGDHEYPTWWSFHPYDDVSAFWDGHGTGYPQTTDTINFINIVYGLSQEPLPSFAITETGAWLRSPTYGAHLNGNPTAQANAAQGFKNILNVSSQIKQVYWYDFEAVGDGVSNGSDNFDSALLGIDSPTFIEAGSNGIPRADYCVQAFNETPATAVTDSRCDFASNPPVMVPWTSWQAP